MFIIDWLIRIFTGGIAVVLVLFGIWMIFGYFHWKYHDKTGGI